MGTERERDEGAEEKSWAAKFILDPHFVAFDLQPVPGRGRARPCTRGSVYLHRPQRTALNKYHRSTFEGSLHLGFLWLLRISLPRASLNTALPPSHGCQRSGRGHSDDFH